MDQQSRFRVTCTMFSSLPRADGGRAEEGRYESEELKTVTTVAFPGGDSTFLRPPRRPGLPLPRPRPGGGLVAGSRARALTTVTGDTMAEAAAGADTRSGLHRQDEPRAR